MHYMVVITQDNLASLALAKQFSGLGFEIRLDTFSNTPNFRDIRALTNAPLLATYRSKPHLGQAEPSMRETVGWQWRLEALGAGFEAVDVELDEINIPQKLTQIKQGGGKSLLSHHQQSSGDQLLIPLKQALSFEPDMVKVIGLGASYTDFDVQKRAYELAGKHRLVFFLMGEEYKATRFLSLKYGAPFTFVLPDDTGKVAPGVPYLSELKKIMTGNEEGDLSHLFAVVGTPIGHSQSPVFHNQKLQHRDSNSLFIAVPVQAGELVKALDAFPKMRGLAVTKPLKEEAFHVAKSFTDAAIAQLGAINTLFWQDNQWVGANTDYQAMKQLLETCSSSDRVRVLGYGGLGKAVVLACLELGLRVEVCNRSQSRLESLADGVTIIPWDQRHQGNPTVLVQATSAGMEPNPGQSPLDDIPSSVHSLIETIYNPKHTRLVEMALAKGIHVVFGLTLFQAQADIQNGYFLQSLSDSSS